MRVLNNMGAHRIEAYDDDGTPMGNLVYKLQDGDWHATHTWTDSQFRGHGVAGAMLEELVKNAREQGKKIVPVCQFVVEKFEALPDKYRDVMKSF